MTSSNPPKDKNGKEIYEGDIVKHGTKLGVIRWFAPTRPAYIIFIPKGSYSEDSWAGSHNDLDGRPGSFGHSSKLEVIGNIYSNPELLKGNT